jgi:hypothetical protein
MAELDATAVGLAREVRTYGHDVAFAHSSENETF